MQVRIYLKTSVLVMQCNATDFILIQQMPIHLQLHQSFMLNRAATQESWVNLQDNPNADQPLYNLKPT